MKSMKLSVAGRITALMAIASLSGTAMADIRALGDVKVQKQANGVEVVDINAPNAQGLSHNKYHQFNVYQPGAVLNNSKWAIGACRQLKCQLKFQKYRSSC